MNYMYKNGNKVTVKIVLNQLSLCSNYLYTIIGKHSLVLAPPGLV